MDALIVLMVVVATVLVFDVLAIFFGQDACSFNDDDWARPWSSTSTSRTEC